MWRLLQWYSTCPCCEMIHLQVCLSASQAPTHSFSPPLPRWAKAPHLLRLQRHRLFSHMTSLPGGEGGGSCLSLWIPTKQALMASFCLTWVNFIQLWKICILCGTNHDIKWERTETWHHFSPHKRNWFICTVLLNDEELNVLKDGSDMNVFKNTNHCEASTQRRRKK